MRQNKENGLVYSTDQGRLCPGCGRGTGVCGCREKVIMPPAGNGEVRIGRETKRRKGAGVTSIRGVSLSPPELAKLAGMLKKKCGSGGTVKEGIIEIQGDHRKLLCEVLGNQGYRVKLTGG